MEKTSKKNSLITLIDSDEPELNFKIINDSFCIKKFDGTEFRINSMLVVNCNYDCSKAQCWEKFAVAEDNIPFLILRPIVLSKEIIFSNLAFSVVWNKNSITNAQSSLIKEFEDTVGDRLKRIIPHKTNFLYKILLTQKEIVFNPKKRNTLDELSRIASRSPSWLSNKFKSTTGITIGQFKSKVKLCCALWDIINSEKSLKEIAVDIGYDPLYFSYKFKLVFGSSPSFFRKF
ncbi:MAG: helix-turn-helix domain-containing protein [Acidobacteriota bacterium]